MLQKGAIAIYDEKQHKTNLPQQFDTVSYIPNKEQLKSNISNWFCRSASFREIVQHHVQGGIKTELKSKRFYQFPSLPPLKNIEAHCNALKLSLLMSQKRYNSYEANDGRINLT